MRPNLPRRRVQPSEPSVGPSSTSYFVLRATPSFTIGRLAHSVGQGMLTVLWVAILVSVGSITPLDHAWLQNVYLPVLALLGLPWLCSVLEWPRMIAMLGGYGAYLYVAGYALLHVAEIRGMLE